MEEGTTPTVELSQTEKKYSGKFMMYKPFGSVGGCASQWSLGSERDCVFLEMAPQDGKDSNGNHRFDWKNKLIFKLGAVDIGEILAVLVGLKQGVGPYDTERGKNKGLYHSNNHGNAVLYFGKSSKDDQVLNIALSVQRGKSPKSVLKHKIKSGESCVLSTLLRRAIEIIHNWD